MELFVPNPLRCFNCNTFGYTSQRCRTTAKCQRRGKNKHEEECDGPQICSNCKGPHTVSAKGCPVWKKEEIQRIRVEKRISFPEARQLVEATFPSKGFTAAVSFADVVNKKKMVKSCGLSDKSHLGFFGHSRADCPFCCTYFWRSRIGIDHYPGFLREVRAGFGRCPGTARVRVASGQEFWVSWCWTQCFPQASGFDPVGWVRVQF